jgi:ubiquinol oxidase
MRTHYAEADNELHHLLIMEELGGNERGFDRFFAQSISFCYFWYVIVVYSLNEAAAYHLRYEYNVSVVCVIVGLK